MRTALPLMALVLFAGCGGSDRGGETTAQARPAHPAAVDIASFEYQPATAEVARGTTLRWTNSDTAEHTATADDRSFDTQTIAKGGSRRVVFKRGGRFAYHCDFHPFMKGTVVVR